MDLDSFAPPVDIQAELAAASAEPDVRIDAPRIDAPRIDVQSEEKTATVTELAAETEPDDSTGQEVKVVPLRALSESRRVVREMREQLAGETSKHAAQIAELTAKLEALANPPAKEPSFDDNPAENLRQRQERLENEQKVWREKQDVQARDAAAEVEHRRILNYIGAEVDKAEASYIEKNPDYHEAVAYLREVSAKNLRAQGLTDPARIQQITHEQALNMAANAIEKGLNPADVAYAFAKNYGYRQKIDATKQIKAMAEAQGRTQTMGNAKPDTGFSIAALAAMSSQELDDIDLDDKTWNKIIKHG